MSVGFNSRKWSVLFIKFCLQFQHSQEAITWIVLIKQVMQTYGALVSQLLRHESL